VVVSHGALRQAQLLAHRGVRPLRLVDGPSIPGGRAVHHTVVTKRPHISHCQRRYKCSIDARLPSSSCDLGRRGVCVRWLLASLVSIGRGESTHALLRLAWVRRADHLRYMHTRQDDDPRTQLPGSTRAHGLLPPRRPSRICATVSSSKWHILHQLLSPILAASAQSKRDLIEEGWFTWTDN